MLPSTLPSFENPPVGEVVLSVQFEPIATLQAAHLGLFWDRFRSAYPRTETHAPIAPMLEVFESTEPTVRFQFKPVASLPRVWFISEDERRLIQVQSDRFICNWRRRSESDEYPRYEPIRESFNHHWDEYIAFLRSEHLVSDAPRIQQVEISYLNHVSRGSVWSTHADAHKICKCLGAPVETGGLRMESVSFATHSIIEDPSGGAPIGRLHCEFEPGFNADGDSLVLLSLVARGISKDSSVDFLDLGRRLIVQHFRDMTTSEMHGEWRLHG